MLVIAGGQIFVDPHQPATLFRVFGSQSTRAKLGKPVAAVGLMAISVALIMLCFPATTGCFLQIIFAWGVQHWLAQTYGIALIYCYKRDYRLSKAEREIMHAMVRAAIIYLWFRLFYKELDGPHFTLGAQFTPLYFIPDWLYNLSLTVLLLSMAVFAVMVIRKFILEKRFFPLPALANLLTLMLLPFLAHDTRIVISALASPFFHSSQYLVVTAAFYLKEHSLAPLKPSQISRLLFSRTFAKYFAVVFTAGLFLCILLPYSMTYLGIAKSLAFPTVYVMLNFHHFITDAYIWKLRDPDLQRLLVA